MQLFHELFKSTIFFVHFIGSVIRNPEIQAIVPQLLKALQECGAKTGECLQTLLDTKFVHFIDAPSLALIMPVVQRAFKVSHFFVLSSFFQNPKFFKLFTKYLNIPLFQFVQTLPYPAFWMCLKVFYIQHP